jgi:polyhydroxyalkanoate synthesis repressor PhaR
VDTKAAAKEDAPKGTARVVKRYSNRKLYDTQGSRYVTLLQIAEMVRNGEEVQIIDNNTKEDLTEVTLAQIIYEEKKANSRTVPLQTLKELIHQRTEKVLSDLREGPIGRLIPGTTPAAPKSEPPKAEPPKVGGAPEPVKEEKIESTVPGKPSLVDQAKGTFEDWQHRIDERVKAALPGSILPRPQLELELKRLSNRIDELETRVKELEGKR